MSDTKREFGIVKTFDPLKGFGFIRRNEGKDVFVFYDDINGNDAMLAGGDQVSFFVEKAAKGPRARDVSKEGQ